MGRHSIVGVSANGHVSLLSEIRMLCDSPLACLKSSGFKTAPQVIMTGLPLQPMASTHRLRGVGGTNQSTSDLVARRRGSTLALTLACQIC